MSTMGEQFANMELMDKLVTLCKRRGFVFASSEPYSGLAGFWDFGPLGVELKRNIERFWWDYMVRRRDNVVGLDSACIGPESVWTASGHVGAFNDALVDDKNSKERFRIDQLQYQSEEDAEKAELYALNWLSEQARSSSVQPLTHELAPNQRLESAATEHVSLETSFWDGLREHIGYYPNNPNTGKPSRFTIPRQFNLMFRQHIGATGEGGQTGYLRAETCQPIFVDFEQVRVASRGKVPFGIAQVGKAFRNEINPRNFLFRAREFEQMELEFFVRPDELTAKMRELGCPAERGLQPALSEKGGPKSALQEPDSLAPSMDWYDYWLAQRREYYRALRIPDSSLSIHPHPPEKLAHYARAACDIYFQFPHGQGELEGVHHRGDYDLRQHQTHSGKSFAYYDDEAFAALTAAGMDKEEAKSLATYLPVCIETSVGLGRTFLAVLAAAYDEDRQDTKHEGKEEDIRIVLRLHPRLAPVSCAVFPLSKKLSGPESRAYRLYRELIDAGLSAEFDDAGSIGKRYRRQDEIGTPWCITYDFDSEQDGAVTIRDRDSLEQLRVPLGEVVATIQERLRTA